MITYEVDLGPIPAGQETVERYRIEFRAPTTTATGEVYDDVLIWVDNLPRGQAEALLENVQRDPTGRVVFCGRCPAGTLPEPHEHDSLPEEVGWLNGDITQLRIMPMREAI